MKNQTPVQYEMLVHKLFSTELAQHVNLSDFKMFHDKKYLGKSGHKHQIDVSAELRIAGVKVLILVECKRYAHRVGIDDVMELATRLDDIGAHKGILVTTVGFQDGAVKMAKSKGIALVKACDLGWLPRYESPVAAMMRHEEFCKVSDAFITWYLGPDAGREAIDNAVKRIAAFDVISPLGVTPHQFGSLRKGHGHSGVELASMFAPPHAFVVEGEPSQIILDTRGLFTLMVLDQDLSEPNSRPTSRST